MPANRKYLTTSAGQRFAKISAGILGGYLLSAFLHMVLALWLDHKVVLITSLYTMFLLWTGLIIVPFLFKNGWKAWGLYLGLLLLLGVVLYFGKRLHPIV